MTYLPGGSMEQLSIGAKSERFGRFSLIFASKSRVHHTYQHCNIYTAGRLWPHLLEHTVMLQSYLQVSNH